MQHNYTDDEIRAILLKERKAELRRKRIIRRCTAFSVLIVILVICAVVLVKCVSSSNSSNAESTSQSTESLGRIFIDPGHGGVDGGTDANGRLEKDDTLKLALLVRKELKALGYEVKMSRTKDKDVERSHRGELANEWGAELFVSIHRNQASEGDGVEVWIPSDDNASSRLLGEKIFKALVKQGFSERSVSAGTLTDSSDDYLENSVPTMPSCLVEVGFTNSAKDNELFDNNLKANAKAIAKAISASYKQIYGTETDESEKSE